MIGIERRAKSGENANMIIIYQRKDLISVEVKDKILSEFDVLLQPIEPIEYGKNI